MAKFLRSPLTWMIVAEILVVSALVAIAWTMVSAGSRPALASPAVVPPEATADDPNPPLPDLPTTSRPQRGPLPGLNLDSSFWRARLARLNSDQAFFVQMEWRLVHSAMDAIRHYLETVVLPAIQRAEHR